MDNIFRYFSQYGEDFLLWNFFDYKSQGFFIDIGAFDGIHLSNSYSFELIGWTGVCVEPSPLYFKLCQENRSASKCFNVACVKGDNKGLLKFNIDSTGLFSSLQNIDYDENIQGHYGALKDINLQVETVEVNSTSLNSLLSKTISNDMKIDFISIDVEGVEVEVLQGFDLDKYKPRIICIETNSDKSQEEITSYLNKFGYLWARKTNANSFFVANDADCEKINNIKLNCVIEKQMHPLGEAYTPPSYKSGLAFHEGVDIFKKYQRIIYENRSLQDNNKPLQDKIKSIQNDINSMQKKLREQRESIDKLNNELTDRDKIIADLSYKLSRTFLVRVKKLVRKFINAL